MVVPCEQGIYALGSTKYKKCLYYLNNYSFTRILCTIKLLILSFIYDKINQTSL